MPRCSIWGGGNIKNRAAFLACLILVSGRQKKAADTLFPFHIGLSYFPFILTAAAELELL